MTCLGQQLGCVSDRELSGYTRWFLCEALQWTQMLLAGPRLAPWPPALGRDTVSAVRGEQALAWEHDLCSSPGHLLSVIGKAHQLSESVSPSVKTKPS